MAKKSGLVVNEDETKKCLFYKEDMTTVTLKINSSKVKTKKVRNLLGVLFDSKMNWPAQVEQTKANKALNAIKLIMRFFSYKELPQIITSNFLSILFYKSEIWYLPKLNKNLTHSIFALSAQALKMSLHYPSVTHSHCDLHTITQICTVNMRLTFFYIKPLIIKYHLRSGSNSILYR
jgi:hypothetical protein